MPPKQRTKIPDSVDFDIEIKSGRKCCVCKKSGDHIHHLDSDPSNNKAENLILLCFNDHNEATTTAVGLRRGLTKARLIRYRDKHYHEISAEQAASKKAVASHTTKITTEDLLQAAKDAHIILELDNIKADCHNADWKEKEKQIEKLVKYIAHSSDRVAYDILIFLECESSLTRAGMPESLSSAISQMAMNYFANWYHKSNKTHDFATGKICLAIGFNIAYDSAIKLRKLSHTPNALTLWKHVYKHAKNTENAKLMQEVVNSYNSLEETLQRPERDDLRNALELVRVFRSDLEEPSMAWPVYPKHLASIGDLEENR